MDRISSRKKAFEMLISDLQGPGIGNNTNKRASWLLEHAPNLGDAYHITF